MFFFFPLVSCGRDGPRSGDVRVAPSFVAGALVSSFRTPAKPEFFSPPLQGEGWGMVLVRCSVSFSRHSGESRNPFCSSAFDLRRYAKSDSHPCAVCPPSLAASHFLLLAQEKVTKEKGTLATAVTRASCPRDYASRLRGSLTVRPCTDSERARILRAPLRAFSYAPLPRPRGTRGQKRSAAVPAAEARLHRLLRSCSWVPL